MRPVSHEDQLTLVEHLDELRTRIIVCLVVLTVAFGLCFWQNHLLLEIASRPLPSDHEKLLTFGVAEPFTITITVAAYGALILSLPVLIYQLYAYVLPAFSDRERRVVLPIVLLAPVLFLAGVAFAYYLVMPAAVKFLLNFNDSQFNVQVRARDYSSCRWQSSPSPGWESSASSRSPATGAMPT
jgi:Tat protein translocase TatC